MSDVGGAIELALSERCRVLAKQKTELLEALRELSSLDVDVEGATTPADIEAALWAYQKKVHTISRAAIAKAEV